MSSLKINQNNLNLFSWASGDHNLIHQNKEVAQSMGLSNVVAHGMYFFSWVIVQVENFYSKEFSKKVPAHSLKAKFYSPAVLGDELNLKIDLSECHKKLIATVVNQKNEKISVLTFQF